MAKKSSSVSKAVKRGEGKKDSGEPSAVSDQTISRVRELAWMGKHAQAIDLATQALSASKIKPIEQMDLLDLRAESYLALLNFEAAEQDVKQMERLAKAASKPSLQSQA